MKKVIEKLEEFIKEKDVEADHMLRTGYWIKKLYPEVDETMYIVAICHDIERIFPLRNDEIKPLKTGIDKLDQEYLAWHGERSAEFTEKLLRGYGLNNRNSLNRIKTLISNHSVGGDREKDLIMDADSISLIENNIPLFIKEGKDNKKLKEKVISEFERLSSKKAREFAQPFYKKVMEKLSEPKNEHQKILKENIK